MEGAGFAVSGIVETQRALRQVDATLPRELRVIGNRAAERIVDVANRNASRLGSADRKAAAAGLRARSQQRNVAVSLRATKRVPWVFGREFGAARDVPRTRTRNGRRQTYVGYRQFRAWRGSGNDAGYWLYPAVRSEGARVADDYLKGVDTLLRRVGM